MAALTWPTEAAGDALMHTVPPILTLILILPKRGAGMCCQIGKLTSPDSKSRRVCAWPLLCDRGITCRWHNRCAINQLVDVKKKPHPPLTMMRGVTCSIRWGLLPLQLKMKKGDLVRTMLHKPADLE